MWIIGSDNKSAHTVTPGKPLGEGRGNNFRKILVTKTLWTIYRLHTLLKHYKVIKLDILVKEAVLLFILDTWVSMWIFNCFLFADRLFCPRFYIYCINIKLEGGASVVEFPCRRFYCLREQTQKGNNTHIWYLSGPT